MKTCPHVNFYSLIHSFINLFISDPTPVLVKVVMSPDERIRIIKAIHEGVGDSVKAKSVGGHFGRDKTTAKISERYYWPSFHYDVIDHIKTCHDCQMSNKTFSKAQPTLHPIPVPGEPWVQIGIDLCSLPKTEDGYTCFVLAVDYFSKWAEADGLRYKDAAQVALFLYKTMCKLGAVKIQINDQGREFVNEVASELHKLTGVKQRLTAAYHPQTNGLTERGNRTVHNSLLKVLQDQHLQRIRALPGIISAYNTSRQHSTGYSPFQLMFNRQARRFIEMDSKSDSTNTQEGEEEAEPIKIDTDEQEFTTSMERNLEVGDFVYKAVDRADDIRKWTKENISVAQERQFFFMRAGTVNVKHSM